MGKVLNDGRANRLREHLPDVPQVGFERLVRSLDRTDRGFDRDLRTPFAGESPREEVLGRLEESIGHTDYQELEEIDAHEREKVGPISIMLPYSDRRDDVLEYGHQEFNADETAMLEAAERVRLLIPERSLRVAAFETAFDMMPKDTSLGLPLVTNDRSVVGEYYQRATQLSRKEDIYPTILYWRGQADGSNKTKQRVVFGFDHAETIFGATVLYPLLHTLRDKPGFSAWLGDVFVDQAISNLLNESRGRSIISMDYTGFDRSLPVELLDVVDDVLGSWFVDPGFDRVMLLADISNSVPIVVPYDLELTARTGGMPSGSVLTNMRDTIANLIAGEYIGIRSKSLLARYEVLGDDGVFVFKEDMDPEGISTFAAELGLTCNPDKQFVSTNSAHYLQRWHSLEYKKDGLSRGVRSPYRAMSGILGYERYRQGWNKYLDTSRWIMQFENLKNDPRFNACVKFLRDNDKLLMTGIDAATVFKKAGGADVIRSTLNIASFPFNVQNPDRVESFETTRVLRSLN
jgi:hypothetical protein